MNEHLLISAMLAGRQVLRRKNPELLAWSRRQWETWLQAERSAQQSLGEFRLLVVAALTCMEDLPLHVGLLQLLGIPGLRCTVVLNLPTEEMARLVRTQARRDEWAELVHVVSEADCAQLLRRLPASAALAVFLLPGVLSEQSPSLLATRWGSSKAVPQGMLLPDGAGFLGRAADYAACSYPRGSDLDDRFSAAIRLILSQDPERQASTLENTPVPRKTGGGTEGWTGAIHSLEGRAEVPGLELGDELVVMSLPDHADPAVVARQCGALCEPGQLRRIRMPPSLLTVAPQRIRLESYGADGIVTGTDILFHVPPSRLKSWMISAFLNRGGGGNAVMRAFAEGTGCRIAYAEDEPDTLRDIPVVWGVLRESDRILAQAKAQDFYFFYIDHAYFNRGHGKSYRITRNGYEAGAIRNCPSDRFSSFDVDLVPWRKSGREIVVCPPTEYFMQAHGCPDWLETTLATLRSVTDRPITVRLKPQPGEEAVPLPKALGTAHALVTHSSNVAIEAACLGTPVFVAPASAAAPIGRTDLSKIETPTYPDRELWLWHLAYNQFSFEEIRDGRAWRMLLEFEERDLV